MKATLFIPNRWQQDQRYAALSKPDFLNEFGRQISRTIKRDTNLHPIPSGSDSVALEWTKDDGKEDEQEPILIVEIAAIPGLPQRESVAQSTSRLAFALTQSRLYAIIPDCLIRLRIVHEYTFPLGG